MKAAERMSGARRLLARLASLDSRLARVQQEQAEILAERARLLSEEAGHDRPVDLSAKQRCRRTPAPVAPIAAPTDLDKVRAERALQKNATRRRSTR